MEKRVQEELDSIAMMVENWRDSYIRMITGDGDEGFLVSDLVGEIEEHIYPYLRRFRECEYITSEEESAFIERLFENIDRLTHEIEIATHSYYI